MPNRRPLSLLLAGLCAVGLTLCLFFRTDYFGGIALTLMRWPVVLLAGVLAFRLRHRLLPFLLCVALASVAVGQWVWVGVARAEPAKQQRAARTLRVVTHNVMFRGARMSASLETLKGAQADLVAVQEVTPTWEAALDGALLEQLPHKVARAHAGTHGYAVYSRFPVSDVVYLNNDEGRPFAQCFTLELPEGPLPVCNVHLASPAGALSQHGATRIGALEVNARQRAKQWGQLEAHFAGSTTRLALGDFNTMEVEPLYGTITSGWVDAFRRLHAGPGATWPNDVRGLRPFARIDYVVTAGNITPRESSVLRRSGSDHLAVRAELAVAATP